MIKYKMLPGNRCEICVVIIRGLETIFKWGAPTNMENEMPISKIFTL